MALLPGIVAGLAELQSGRDLILSDEDLLLGRVDRLGRRVCSEQAGVAGKLGR